MQDFTHIDLEEFLGGSIEGGERYNFLNNQTKIYRTQVSYTRFTLGAWSVQTVNSIAL